MTEQQRQQRDAFIREKPYSWLLLLYTVVFFTNAVCNDVLSWAGATVPDLLRGYFFPFVIAFPLWRIYRRGAQQKVAAPESEKTSQEHSGAIESQSSFAIKKTPRHFF